MIHLKKQLRRKQLQPCGQPSQRRGSNRRGSSLAEILMALMIMGLGVVTVATLFPAAVLRTAHANRMTNSTILRYNAESLIQMYRNLIHYPDPNDDNDVAVDATSEADYYNSKYWVDPLGWYLLDEQNSNYRDELGGVNATGILRFNAGMTDVTEAEDLVTLPDTWVNSINVEGPVTDAAREYVEFTNTPITAEILQTYVDAATAGQPVRAVLVSEDGKHSVKRALTAGDINTGTLRVSWTGNPLPNDGNYDSVLIARLEIEERRRFSYMLSVRKNRSGVANVDVVTFSGRTYSELDEVVYSVNAQAGDTTGRVYDVTYTAGEEVYWSRGGFLFDPDACLWYRIQQVDRDPGNGLDTLTLERRPSKTLTNGVFLRGVVDVYPIGSKI